MAASCTSFVPFEVITVNIIARGDVPSHSPPHLLLPFLSVLFQCRWCWGSAKPDYTEEVTPWPKLLISFAQLSFTGMSYISLLYFHYSQDEEIHYSSIQPHFLNSISCSVTNMGRCMTRAKHWFDEALLLISSWELECRECVWMCPWRSVKLLSLGPSGGTSVVISLSSEIFGCLATRHGRRSMSPVLLVVKSCQSTISNSSLLWNQEWVKVYFDFSELVLAFLDFIASA